MRFDGREVWVRAYPLPIDSAATFSRAAAPGASHELRARDPARAGAST